MNKPQSKQSQLFLDWSDDEVHTMAWFNTNNISHQLVHKYQKCGLIKKLGGGGYIKAKDKLNWQAALFTAQSELNLPIHVGGRSVFDLLKSGQFLNLGKNPNVFVVVREKVRIPIWLKQNDWGVKFQFKTSKLFVSNLGLEVYKRSKFKMIMASRERAIMELIDSLDLSESFETLEQYCESLINIRTDLTQKLLEICTSVKVKRVFLYIATKLDLPVAKKLDVTKIDFGAGKRIVVKNGVFDKDFNITVPKPWRGNEGP